VETNATRMCALLVALPDVTVLAVDDQAAQPIRVHVESLPEPAWCRACGARARVKDRPVVELIDLRCFGRAARLVWRKHRWCCPEPLCPTGSWTHVDERIAAPRVAMTARASRWATIQVGRLGRSVNEVAEDLGCDWHTVKRHRGRLRRSAARRGCRARRRRGRCGLGRDSVLSDRAVAAPAVVHLGRERGRPGQTAQLIDVVAGRSAAKVLDWLDEQPEAWKDQIRWGVLDLSGPYRKVFNDGLGHVTQVADPFHVCKLANSKLDECRRRVQNDTLGHRGRKSDPLYRARRLLTKAHERLDDRGEAKLTGLLAAGDPRGEVRMAWHAKETVRGIYDIDDPDLAREFVTQLGLDLQDESCPTEVHSLGRTLRRWLDQITAWHQAKVTNGPTEAINNLIKRIKRIGFGFRRLRNYRIRALLYAGRPNWDLLNAITPRWGGMPPCGAAGGVRRQG
jgi:transposase